MDLTNMEDDGSPRQLVSKWPLLADSPEHHSSPEADDCIGLEAWRKPSPEDLNSRSIQRKPPSGNVPQRLWAPFFLRRTSMLVFMGAFTAILLVLVALFIYSERNSGVSSPDEANYYFWTYGPTAGELFPLSLMIPQRR